LARKKTGTVPASIQGYPNSQDERMPARRLLILDKNFLQSEDSTTPRLCALARCVCEFVLLDTLIYELCSDSRLPNLWPSIQKKLFPFADRMHLWFHSSELLRREVTNNAPTSGPEDSEATQRLRDRFRSGLVYVPSNLNVIVKDAHKQREIDTMEKVGPMARVWRHDRRCRSKRRSFEPLQG
jgi:hypothetical protein